MCGLVFPKSRRADHMAEHRSFLHLYDIRSAVDELQRSDKVRNAQGPADLALFESYRDGIIPPLRRLLEAVHGLRESLHDWREADNAIGAREYTI